MSKKVGKILASFLLVLLLFGLISNVYAEINEEYYQTNLGAFKVNDTKDSLNKKTLASILLEAIGILVYALASLGEWLLGYIFQVATGGDIANNIFPWADAIVFNAIPFLDINFLNPHSSGTVVGLIQDVLKSTYGTIFGLAISFFSIAVLVMGIKIAISTIASEKAKYKQAIWDWILGLVLLFTMHIFISFVFYLNESLVNEASVIASNSFNSKEAKNMISAISKSQTDEEVVNNFIEVMKKNTIQDFVNPVAWGNNIASALSVHISDLSVSEAENILKSNPKIARLLLQDNRITSYLFADDNDTFARLFTIGANTGNGSVFWSTGRGDEYFIIQMAKVVKCLSLEEFYAESKYEELKSRTDLSKDETKLLNFFTAAKEIHSNTSGDSLSVIANLAQYFKSAAWTSTGNSWKNGKVVIQNALMYAILVVQSFIFLIAYVKRLFYVIILAMMAPVVVVYDFFNKSIS